MARIQEIKPIDYFKTAHERSKAFISGGKGNKGRRDADDLRAAVVFAVASIDAFFRAKIIHVLRKGRQLSPNNFKLSESAQRIIQKAVAKAQFRKEYNQLNRQQKDIIDTYCTSTRPALITYLESALKKEMSFQSIDQLGTGMKIMDKKPQEIWQRINSNINSRQVPKKVAGRPKKIKRGRKVNITAQLIGLFERRNKIVHEADLSLQSRKHRGKERQIKYDTVKKWIDSVEKMVTKMDGLI